MSYETAWETDVRIRIRPGRANSGTKLYVTDHGPHGSHEFMANTGFFRYPGLLDVLVSLLAGFPADRPLRVLIVPLSVGLEAVSLVIAGLRAGLFDDHDVTVEGFDISEKATQLARLAVYPRLFFPDDLSGCDGMLEALPGGFIRVAEAVTGKISVLPARDILAFEPERPYDMVVCLNLLMHLDAEDRAPLVARLAAITAPDGILCLNNNQEWPAELVPYFTQLTAPEGGFGSLHAGLAKTDEERTTPAGPVPEFAMTDANAMILRRIS